MNLPILIITYNRFDFVLQILQTLHKSNVRKVYVAVDDYNRDNKSFEPIESYLNEHGFEHKILKWHQNVGCEYNVLNSCKWFFEHEQRGIILEDDCIPTEGFFHFVSQLEHLNIHQHNISFTAFKANENETLHLEPIYIPFFWGWYTTKNFYNSFYEFCNQKNLSLTQVLNVLCEKNLSLKNKLICLINYVNFSYKRVGTSWDSLLHFYQVYTRNPFLVPSSSMIKNLGFGNLNANYTHTDKEPYWYKQLSFFNLNTDKNCTVKTYDVNTNNNCLHQFFIGYSNNNLKLMAYFVKKYVQYIMKNRKRKKERSYFYKVD